MLAYLISNSQSSIFPELTDVFSKADLLVWNLEYFGAAGYCHIFFPLKNHMIRGSEKTPPKLPD